MGLFSSNSNSSRAGGGGGTTTSNAKPFGAGLFYIPGPGLSSNSKSSATGLFSSNPHPSNSTNSGAGGGLFSNLKPNITKIEEGQKPENMQVVSQEEKKESIHPAIQVQSDQNKDSVSSSTNQDMPPQSFPNSEGNLSQFHSNAHTTENTNLLNSSSMMGINNSDQIDNSPQKSQEKKNSENNFVVLTKNDSPRDSKESDK